MYRDTRTRARAAVVAADRARLYPLQPDAPGRGARTPHDLIRAGSTAAEPERRHGAGGAHA